MKSKLPWILLISFLSLGGLFVIFVFIGLIAAIANPPETDYSAHADLAVVELIGPIHESKSFLKKLRTIRQNHDLKGVIVRIDSPGGVVGASQEIHEGIKKLSQEKLVIASLGSVAASGGYYAAVAANQIVANAGTLTASIGVRMDYANLQDLIHFLKIDAETLKSGKLKDVGSPLRELKPEEREFLQSILQNLHEQFKKDVAEGRKIPLEELEKIADGRVVTGEQALEYKLVDSLGNEDRAIELAKEQLKLPEDAKVIYPDDRLENLEKFLSRTFLRTFLELKAQAGSQAYYSF
ncbi:MAG: signal peptide peptidase SppA [Deltaproteobacteria bacterium]|nr:signal peptide peptidase SppA [Deltaproteobacteria bacterium]